MLLRIMLISDDAPLRRGVAAALRRDDVLLAQTAAPADVVSAVATEGADILLIDRRRLSDGDRNVVRALRELPDEPDVVALSGSEDAEDRARLIAAGCAAVLGSQLRGDTLKEFLSAVIDRRRERQAVLSRTRAIDRPQLADFVSESPTMRAFMDVVARVSESQTTLLILGETGVGKERLAQAIHNAGGRADGPIVAVNCAALTESLLESELFGHDEGAFTGATRNRRGCFELAHGGTLFLDEVGEMPLHLQAKLLRVLQEREVRRLGSERAIHVDVRLIAATNRDLLEEVEAGRFRKDLYYRLGVVTLRIPPLRERREDIPTLVESYVEHFSTQVPHRACRVGDDAMRALARYDWPGNVRELINVIERAMLLCGGETIDVGDLPAEFHVGHSGDRSEILPVRSETTGGPDIENDVWWRRPLDDIVTEIERRYLVRLLSETNGRVGRTAELSGLSTRGLYEKMRRYGLEKEHFRKSEAS